jgi:hypothetical protein
LKYPLNQTEASLSTKSGAFGLEPDTDTLPLKRRRWFEAERAAMSLHSPVKERTLRLFFRALAQKGI